MVECRLRHPVSIPGRPSPAAGAAERPRTRMDARRDCCGLDFMARRPGFTIAEMLVSVAILAILTAILIPLVSSARAVALRVVCASRLKDLTIACNMHRNEKRAYPV